MRFRQAGEPCEVGPVTGGGDHQGAAHGNVGIDLAPMAEARASEVADDSGGRFRLAVGRDHRSAIAAGAGGERRVAGIDEPDAVAGFRQRQRLPKSEDAGAADDDGVRGHVLVPSFGTGGVYHAAMRGGTRLIKVLFDLDGAPWNASAVVPWASGHVESTRSVCRPGPEWTSRTHPGLSSRSGLSGCSLQSAADRQTDFACFQHKGFLRLQRNPGASRFQHTNVVGEQRRDQSPSAIPSRRGSAPPSSCAPRRTTICVPEVMRSVTTR